MSRLIREAVLNRPDDFVQYIMSDFLSKHGFKLEYFKGEQVYRVGGGMIEIPKFLIWRYQNGVIHIEAWTRMLWLPGVYGRESDLSGFYGAVPKSAYKKDIEELMGLLFQPIDMPQPNPGNPGGSPAYPNADGPKTVYVRGTDMSRYAVMSLVFSLIALATGFFLPYIGIIFGIMGIVYGKKGQNSSKKGMATAAFVIGILATVISSLVLIVGIAAIMLTQTLPY